MYKKISSHYKMSTPGEFRNLFAIKIFFDHTLAMISSYIGHSPKWRVLIGRFAIWFNGVAITAGVEGELDSQRLTVFVESLVFRPNLSMLLRPDRNIDFSRVTVKSVNEHVVFSCRSRLVNRLVRVVAIFIRDWPLLAGQRLRRRGDDGKLRITVFISCTR